MSSEVVDSAKESVEFERVVTAIIRHLQKTPGIKEAQLEHLFRKWIARREITVPEKFKPASLDCWDAIIFRGSWKNVKGKLTPTYFDRIEQTLKYLGLLPPDFAIGDQTWLAYLNRILEYLRTPSKKRDPESLKDALALLLGMNPRHYSVTDAPVGEFFGYRRSSTRGRIVRFYIKIDPSEGTGLLSFDNHYFQKPDHWHVKGCGFKVDSLTYMIGHASPAGDETTSLGLRYFVLNKFRRLGWFVGLLNSMDKHGNPIASRIVLIPAAQHKPVRPSEGATLSQDEVLPFISSMNLTADDLDQQIEIPTPADLNGLRVSTLVQSLIWNGTLRTLHGARAEIPDTSQSEEYEKVFAFQRRAVEGWLSPTDDIEFFVRLLAHDDVREAVMSKLPLP